MTPFALLVQTCGLSHREAAAFLGVSPHTVHSWSSGRNRAPDDVLTILRTLATEIDEAALNAIMEIAARAGDPRTGIIEIGYPADDHEAAQLGFPCVGAWRAVAARVVAGLDGPIVLAPRGSTPATAAAIDARGG